jgi:hypothetical protein
MLSSCCFGLAATELDWVGCSQDRAGDQHGEDGTGVHVECVYQAVEQSQSVDKFGVEKVKLKVVLDDVL